jgi:isoleucyl-tRNA synthetase
MELVAQRVEKEGIEAWFKLDGAELLRWASRARTVGEDQRHARRVVRLRHHPQARAARLARRGHPEGPRADLYLEGSDQHRGWFHSSLLTGCASTATRRTAACSPTASSSTGRAAR